MCNKIESMQEISSAELEQALGFAVRQTETALNDLGENFKTSTSNHNRYCASDNTEWTTGFWTGELWLTYEISKEERFKDAALRNVESFYNRIINRIDVDHHDMGFLYSPSCVAAYQLTGSELARNAALLAADNLVSRFRPVGQFIQAWGELDQKDNYRLIIDCLLNLPLLFWASRTTGDPHYEEVAHLHLETALNVLVRDDNSTYHTYYFDPDSGAPLRGITAQGNRNSSAWSRGQAWGVYGIALAYRYTRAQKYLALFERVSKYFISHLPHDLVPYWDFDFTDGSDEPRDSSSAAIAACGMLEFSRYAPDELSAYYTSVAKKIVRSLYCNYAVKQSEISNGQLLHGTYVRHSEENGAPNRGVDECNAWGDYYYMETLVRLTRSWRSYW